MRRTRRTITAVALGILGAAMAIQASAAGADPSLTTEISLTSVTKTGANLTLNGSLTLGINALAPRTVGTDVAGDATPPNGGLDLGNLTVTPNLSAKTLKFSLALNDGDKIGGNAPLSGVGVPVVADGDDHTWWLGAGGAGSNQGKTGNWTGICNNEAGGWDCSKGLTGAVDGTHVEWTLPFATLPPGIHPGSTIDFTGGGAATQPMSFGWPAVLVGAVAPIDVLDASTYLVPGGIAIAVTPAGNQVADEDFTDTGTFNGKTGLFTGTVAAPTAAGAYTVTVRSCYGSVEAPTCVDAASNITI